MLQQLSYQQDDIENRNGCNNIQIRGLPESVEPKDLQMAVTAIFNQLLQKPKDDPIELNRVHMASGPRNPDPYFLPHVGLISTGLKRPSCVLPALKTLYSNDTPVMILPDLSSQTLTTRKPLTQLLQAHKIKYQWCFPFHHEGKTAIFHTLGDLPALLSTLELPQVSLPDWPFAPTTPGLPFAPPQWQKQDRKPRSRSSSHKDPND